MYQGIWKNLIFLIPLALLGASPAFSQVKALPLDLQIGFEQNEVSLIGQQSDGSPITTEPETSEQAVFKIFSPIKLGCMALKSTFNQGGSSQRLGCLGFGVRASGSQKRLSGNWFPLAADPSINTTYTFRSDQLAVEFLFGQLSEVSLALGLGLRAGLNNYDLMVTKDSQILFLEENKFALFASWVAYIDLQVLFAWPFFGLYSWPSENVFLLYSLEGTIENYNNFKVPDINGTGETEVEIKNSTQTLTLEFIF